MKIVLLALPLALFATQAMANDLPTLSNSQFQQCLNTLKSSAKFKNISSSTFERYRPSQPDPTVIRSLNYQPEFKKDVWDYLAMLVDIERTQAGIKAKREHAETLRRIESRYGVNPVHVLGVWGVESDFGQTLGKKDLFTSLATLSCFDRRQDYFRGEFASALRIVQNGDIRAEDMTGSWAGAFGQTQFMPSTFLELAVDFDGDGRKDLVNNKADALASTANFLKSRGYRAGEPWGYEVKLNGYSGASGRTNKKPVSHWRNMGLTLANGQPLPNNLANAGLLLPAGRTGPAFLVGKNFDTFYAYNASESYALAIAHLSDLIAKESTNVDFITPWPTDDAGISRRQAKEIQQALLNAGYDIGNVDGIIGDNTRRAIMDYQRKAGVAADGRAGQKFYRLIMSRGNAISGVNGGNSGAAFQNTASQAISQPQNTNQSSSQQSTSQSSSISITRGSLSRPTTTGNISYRVVVGSNGEKTLVPVR
ncbi:MAG: lytic murein transglycosylase [Moraxella sp.]|nr:lytic murein transglycosylase [Moraxella sp.]